MNDYGGHQAEQELRRVMNVPAGERTPEQVQFLRTEGAVYGGCCDRFADQKGCACLSAAHARARRQQQALDQGLFASKPVQVMGGPGRVIVRDDSEVGAEAPRFVCPSDKVVQGQEPERRDCIPLTNKYVRAIRVLPHHADLVRVRKDGKAGRALGVEVVSVPVDVYCVIEAFPECKVHAGVEHAVKKLLMPGARQKAGVIQDLREAVQAVQRAIDDLTFQEG